MELAKFTFEYDGKTITEPRNWADISLTLTFDENPQATVDVDIMEFVNEPAQLMIADLDGGLTGVTNGYFEGKSFRILATKDDSSLLAFDGFVNWKESQINSPISISVKIQKKDSIDSLQKQAESITFGLLEDIGLIGASDYLQLPYIVEKIDISVDLVVISLSLYTIVKEGLDIIERIKQYTLTGVALTATAGLGSAVAGPAYTTASLLLDLLFLGFIIVAIIKLIDQMVELLFPKKRFMAVTLYRTLLEKAAIKLGYTFKSDIPQLDFVHYVPSKPFLETDVTSGIPRVNDFGYNVSDFFDLMANIFNAKFGIIDNELHFRTESDPFWDKNSVFKFHEPQPLDEVELFNNAEIKSSILITFSEDLSEEYTIINNEGSIFQILTQLKNPLNPKFNLVQDSEKVILQVSLGTRKNELNVLETILKGFLQISDIFTGGNLASIISGRVGVMIISKPTFSVPKSVYLVNGKLPEDHRTKWDTELLWDEYHNEKSFIQNNFRNQKQLFEQKEIPFGFEDALKLEKNSAFPAKNGKFGKITSLKWFFNKDDAVTDYFIRTIYDTESLKEIFIKP